MGAMGVSILQAIVSRFYAFKISIKQVMGVVRFRILQVIELLFEFLHLTQVDDLN